MGAGVVLIYPEGKIIEYALKFQFRATNNEAEYEVAIAGLQLCRALEAKHVRLRMDSQLIRSQESTRLENLQCRNTRRKLKA